MHSLSNLVKIRVRQVRGSSCERELPKYDETSAIRACVPLLKHATRNAS